MKIQFFLFIFLFSINSLFAQKTTKLIIIPQTDKEICSVFDQDKDQKLQQTVISLEQHFEKLGFEPVHLREVIRQAKGQNKCRPKQSETIQNLLQISTADVYALADVVPTFSPDGFGYVNVVLSIYSNRQAQKLAQITCKSPKLRTQDIALLTSRALKTCEDTLFKQIDVYSLVPPNKRNTQAKTEDWNNPYANLQQRGDTPESPKENNSNPAPNNFGKTPKENFGTYYALIFAVKDYEDRTMSLREPINDAQKLKKILAEKYHFKPENILFVSNPSRMTILHKLDSLKEKLGVKDNLLIFYAGHGYYNSEEDEGYFLPADAHKKNTANWVSNSEIKRKMNAMKTRHILMISDACYSGSMLLRDISETQASQRMIVKKSRKIMTSGSLEPVPDKSVFIKHLITALEFFAQENKTDELFGVPAYELFSEIRLRVLRDNPLQLPQYGYIRETGDEGGEFIFIRK